MRISLKDLLAIVAFCAGVAWCASQVGFDNGVFWFVFGLSAILSGVFIFSASRQKGRGLAPGVAFLCLILGVLFFSPTLFVNALILGVVGIYFASRAQPASVRTVSVVAMVTALIAMVIGALPGIGEGRRLAAMREKFPIVSLENRLEYEKRSRPATHPGIPVISVSVSKRLDGFETNLGSNDYRRERLQMIHDQSYEAFVRTQGFGVGRVIRPNAESLRLPPLNDIRFDDTTADKLGTPWGYSSAFQMAGKASNVEHLHFASHDDFLDPEWFGAVIEPVRKVAGFIPHAFHYPPKASLETPQTWTIDRLELVSLLKFDEPRVYVLDHLPRMDQLSSDSVPTRPLDDFEATSLKQLRTDEDLVITHTGPTYRMLGSLRAATQCINCHTAQRGDLLGAFSYALHSNVESDGE